MLRLPLSRYYAVDVYFYHMLYDADDAFDSAPLYFQMLPRHAADFDGRAAAAPMMAAIRTPLRFDTLSKILPRATPMPGTLMKLHGYADVLQQHELHADNKQHCRQHARYSCRVVAAPYAGDDYAIFYDMLRARCGVTRWHALPHYCRGSFMLDFARVCAIAAASERRCAGGE